MKNSLRIIFLDIDGVLCIKGTTMEPSKIAILKNVLRDVEGSTVVISSGWRMTLAYRRAAGYSTNFDYETCLRRQMVSHGIQIYGYTPVLPIDPLKQRHLEILAYIQANRRDIQNWVAIDDIPLRISPSNHLKTDTRIGLLPEHENQLISMLKSFSTVVPPHVPGLAPG